MLDTIVSLLKESGVYAWEISDVKTTGWEFYFIRHALDQNRVRKVEHITVKVYQLLSDGAWLGSASGEIAPTASAEEARALIEGLAYRATLVKNKPYTLHKPHPAEAAETKPIDAAAIARDFVETMRDLPETAGEDINSYEIFVAEKRRHFLNSEGIDLEESAYLDGCNVFQIYFRIIIPAAKSSFATVAIFAFLWSYNDLFTQSFFLRYPQERAITGLLNEISSQAGVNYGLMAASVVLVVIPVLIVYVCLQKHIIKGLTAGAVKG